MAFVHTTRKNSIQVIMAMAIARYVQGRNIEDIGKLFKAWRKESNTFAYRKKDPVKKIEVTDVIQVDEAIRQVGDCFRARYAY